MQVGATSPVEPALVAVVTAQLSRPARAVLRVAHVCSCGLPDVVETSSRLADGTPFPTLYYLTCPRAAKAVSRLESGGMMREMTERLGHEPELAAAYRRASEDYVRRRDVHGQLPGNPTAGGMPGRVKCLHVLVAHSLAVGPGIQPLGDEALAALPDWGADGPCIAVEHWPGTMVGPEDRP